MLPFGQYLLLAYTIQASLGYGRQFLPGFPFAELNYFTRILLQIAGLLMTWLLTKLIVFGKQVFAAR